MPLMLKFRLDSGSAWLGPGICRLDSGSKISGSIHL